MQKILFFNKVFDGAPDAKSPVRLKKRHQRNLASSHLATVKRALRCFCEPKCRAAEELTSPTAQPRWPEGGKSKRQHEYPPHGWTPQNNTSSCHCDLRLLECNRRQKGKSQRNHPWKNKEIWTAGGWNCWGKKEVLPACLYQQRTKMWENWKRWPNQRNCEHPDRSQKLSWHLPRWPAHGQRAPATGHGAAPLPLSPGLSPRSSGLLLPAARRSAARTYRSGNSSTRLGVTIFRLLINSFCTKAMVMIFCEEKERGGSHSLESRRRTQRKKCCRVRGKALLPADKELSYRKGWRFKGCFSPCRKVGTRIFQDFS